MLISSSRQWVSTLQKLNECCLLLALAHTYWNVEADVICCGWRQELLEVCWSLVQHLNLVSFAKPQNHLQLNKNSVCACSYIYANSKHHFPYTSFFPTGLRTFILAYLSFHSFPQTFQHQSSLCCVCLHIIWHSQLQRCSPYLELSPSISPYMHQYWYLPSSPQDPLLPAFLPIHLTPLLLRLRFGLYWPLCVFINYAYLQISKSISQ